MLPRHGPKKFDNPDVPKKNWGLKDKNIFLQNFQIRTYLKSKMNFT